MKRPKEQQIFGIEKPHRDQKLFNIFLTSLPQGIEYIHKEIKRKHKKTYVHVC